MLHNPKLYEINTIIRLNKLTGGKKLNAIPKNYISRLADKGFDFIWLMGIWKTCTDLIDSCGFQEDLIASYHRSLKDWKREDVTGSPYAIDSYEVNPALGSKDDLLKLKHQMNEEGIKLILDFVPNHLGASSKFIKTHPQIFLKGNEELLNNDSFTFFRPQVNSQEIFAHGRDPFFPAWTDTIQVNYFNSEAREFMINILLSLTELCDGVRCDMAMLSLNNVFENTWLGSIEHYGNDKPKSEFWEEAIKKVKEKSPEFIFIAEAYWDLEWELQQLGFDFTYDKRLLDRLESDDIQGIREHLEADKNSQLKSVRFLENHDESRAITKLGKYKSFAATTIISTIQGMKLYYDGQFEGKKIKLPVQLGREPVEKVSTTVSQFYDLILNITKHEIFKFGDWKQLYPESVGENNLSFQNILTWQWKFKNEIRVIVINYSSGTSYCRLKFDITTLNENISLLDLMTDNVFNRSVNEIKTNGLFIELKSYKSHIFAFND